MTPKAEILPEIEALAIHCRPPLMEAEHRAMWLRDWCADLAEYPMDAIRVGCRKWRQSGATKFPTAGQLMPLIRASVAVEREAPVQPWRAATEDEYREMSVREKIREHLILAHEAFSKAGPMFRNTSGGGSMFRAKGEHLTPEQMSPEHHRWVAEGKRHREEAYRLRQYMSDKPLAVAAQ